MSTLPKIVVYPAKPTIKIGYTYSPNYYDVSDIVDFNDGIGAACCLENWKDCILYASNRDDLDRMEEMYERLKPGSKPVHLAWDGQSSDGRIFTIMVPPSFVIGQPIYFNTKTQTIEFQ